MNKLFTALTLSVINDHSSDEEKREVAPVLLTRADGKEEVLCIPTSCLKSPRPTCLNALYMDDKGEWHLSRRSVAYWAEGQDDKLSRLNAGYLVTLPGAITDVTVSLFPENGMAMLEGYAQASA